VCFLSGGTDDVINIRIKIRAQRPNIINITVFRYMKPFNLSRYIPTFRRNLLSPFSEKKILFFYTGSPDSYRTLITSASKFTLLP
jgi:hypothetical protein